MSMAASWILQISKNAAGPKITRWVRNQDQVKRLKSARVAAGMPVNHK